MLDQRDARVCVVADVASVARPTSDHRLSGSCLMLVLVIRRVYRNSCGPAAELNAGW